MKITKESIDELENQLCLLANDWRKFHSQGDYVASAEIVKQYHLVYRQLLEFGWTGETLLPDSALPNRFMPKEFIDRWAKW